MADSVLSVRIDEELKKKFIGFASECNVGNKDLLQMMVAHFELEQAKSQLPEFGRDVEELQSLSKRIADIYGGMIQRVQLQRLEQENTVNETLETLKREKAQLEEEKKGLIKELQEVPRLKALLKKQDAAVEKCNREVDTLTSLNQLLIQKNQVLEQGESQWEKGKSQLVELKSEIGALRDQNRQLTDEKGQVDYKINVMREEKAQEHQHNQRQLDELIKKMNDSLQLKAKEQAVELKELKLNHQLEMSAALQTQKDKYEQIIKKFEQK